MTANPDAAGDLMLAYMRQWHDLRGHLSRRVGSRDLAEEALQETWLRLAGMGQARPEVRDCHAFLLRIAGNIAIDLLRREVMDAGKPFLGICVGLQLLATIGLEHGETPGLGWIPGSVLPLDVGKQPLRVPHVGWNDVRFLRTDGLYAGMGEKAAFYFVHSYALRPEHPTVISGVTNYGEDFTASLESGNIAATQFHPEKSHHTGLKLLENWRKRALSC